MLNGFSRAKSNHSSDCVINVAGKVIPFKSDDHNAVNINSNLAEAFSPILAKRITVSKCAGKSRLGIFFVNAPADLNTLTMARCAYHSHIE